MDEEAHDITIPRHVRRAFRSNSLKNEIRVEKLAIPVTFFSQDPAYGKDHGCFPCLTVDLFYQVCDDHN